MMKPLLEADTVERIYGTGDNTFTALNGVSLHIDEGESVAIAGESGSGKSTLLHILAALDQPTAGDVRYQDSSLGDMTARERDMLRNREFGFVFQQFYLDERSSIFDNVSLPMMINGVSRAERRKRVEEVLKRLGMGGRIDDRAGQLSGGQRQRVALARALVNRPRVIFADEPTGALDVENGEAVTRLLFELNTEAVTLVLVTHNHELAQRCDRQITIVDGELATPATRNQRMTR